MIDVNIFNTEKTLHRSKRNKKNIFCVSTDKAANPVNMMFQANLMEMYLMRKKPTNKDFHSSIC
jgi:FlaA1/EpsC-like NDP-sugar epimerase